MRLGRGACLSTRWCRRRSRICTAGVDSHKQDSWVSRSLPEDVKHGCLTCRRGPRELSISLNKWSDRWRRGQRSCWNHTNQLSSTWNCRPNFFHRDKPEIRSCSGGLVLFGQLMLPRPAKSPGSPLQNSSAEPLNPQDETGLLYINVRQSGKKGFDNT